MAQRDARGRFVKGNQVALGHRSGRARRVVEETYLQQLLDVVTPSEWEKAIQAVLEKAQKGNIAAFRLIASYAIGNPTSYVQADVSGVAMDLTTWQKTADERLAAVEEELCL